MKKMTKFSALLMALVLAMGSMTACGGNNDKKDGASSAPAASAAANTDSSAAPAGDDNSTGEKQPVTLIVWTPQEEQKGEFGDPYGDNLLKYMADSFNQNQSKWELTIQPAICAEGDVKTEINKDPSVAADVFMFPGDQALQLQKNGILYPLSGDNLENIKANSPAAAIEGVTFTDDVVGEAVYGVPFTPNQWFMYYDKSKFSEEEVKSLDTMMSKDLGKDVYNFSMPITNSWYAQSFFFAAGCELFTGGDDTIDTFNNDAGVAAANYMIDLVANKKFLYEDGNGVGISYFKEGKLGAWCGGSWDAASVKKALKDNYGVAALPTAKIGDTEENIKPFADYKYIGVNANSQNTEAAEDFAEWLGGEQCQKDRYAARGVIPTWTTLAEDAEISKDSIVTALDAQKDKLAARGQTQQMDQYWTPMEAFAKGVYNKEITKDNAKEKLDEMVKNQLTKVTE